MRHGILDERLQEQRRHQAGRRARVSRQVDVQPIAESDPLDCQEAVDQLELARHRNPALAPERERLAQELGEQETHPPRRRRIRCGQRTNRVQAVEQEMRIEL